MYGFQEMRLHLIWALIEPVCPGNSIILNAGIGFQTYHWQDGTSASVYTVSSPGIRTVDVTDSCGNSFSDAVLVSLGNLVSIDIGPDREKCNNDTINLHAPAGFINYNWSPDYNINSLNAQSVVVNPSVDTSYFIKAEKTPGCFGFDTFHIEVHHSPTINLGAAGHEFYVRSNRFYWMLGLVSQVIHGAMEV